MLKYFAILFLTSSLLVGCATPIKPDSLERPNQVSCIFLPNPISYKETRGLLSIEWEYRLERGPYIAEKADKDGTYFRAPPGGVYIGRPDMKDQPASLVTHMVRDGGFWIPNDPSKQLKMYRYISTTDVEAAPASDEVTCSSLAYVTDPSTSKISVASFGASGAIGGVLGRAMVPNSRMSYGQSAVGGAIAGVIVAVLINMDVGKITSWTLNNDAFVNQLKTLSTSATMLPQIDSITSNVESSPISPP